MGVLFSPGLEGVIAAVSAISNIEAERGSVAYRGYDTQILVEQSCYEEVAFLLLYGRLPDAGEFQRFCDELSQNRGVPDDLINAVRPVAHKAQPMDMLRVAVAFLGMTDPEARDPSREALFRKSIRTIA